MKRITFRHNRPEAGRDELGSSGGIATWNDLMILNQALCRLFEASIFLDDESLKYLLSSLGALSVWMLMDDAISTSANTYRGRAGTNGSGGGTEQVFEFGDDNSGGREGGRQQQRGYVRAALSSVMSRFQRGSGGGGIGGGVSGGVSGGGGGSGGGSGGSGGATSSSRNRR